MMDRILILLAALMVGGVMWLVWQGAKAWLRRSIRVDRATSNNDHPTLLYFSSDDCLPCRTQQSPIVSKLRQELGGNVSFREYDAVRYSDLAQRYRVFTVPTTIVVAPGGRIVAVNYGVTQADKLRLQLAEAAAKPGEVLVWSH